MSYEIYCDDCMAVMATLRPASVDMVFADLPYGTTYAEWDDVIPMGALWDLYDRVAKPNAALVFTAVQPFTSALIASKPSWFRVEWIWDKVNGANFGNASRMPMKCHESVLVFGKNPTRYFPQKTVGKPNHTQGTRGRARVAETARIDPAKAPDNLTGLKYPKTIQTFPKHSSQVGLHPTQKPVSMVEYFIRTYSAFGETVLDNTMGSGTTGVAAANAGRKFIGIEKDEKYFRVAKKRVQDAYDENDWARLV